MSQTTTPVESAPTGRPLAKVLGRTLLTVVVLIIVVFWVWVFSGAPAKKNPDYLHDRAFAHRTAATCAITRRAINKLTPAGDSKTATERSQVVDQATDDLSKMVTTIAADKPSDVSDTVIVNAWLGDWVHYLGNRRDYSNRLRKDDHARFLVDQKPKANDSYDTVIKNFADINDIPDCGPTLDVG